MWPNGLWDSAPVESSDAKNPWSAERRTSQDLQHRAAEQQRQNIAAYISSSETICQSAMDPNRPNQAGRNWEVLDGLHRRLGVLRDDVPAEELEVLVYQASETLRLFFTYPRGLEKVHVASAMARLLRVSERLPVGSGLQGKALAVYDEYLLRIHQNHIPSISIDILGAAAKKRVQEIIGLSRRV